MHAAQSARLVASLTWAGVYYHVTSASCSCPDFTFHQGNARGYACKHMRLLFGPFAHWVRCGERYAWRENVPLYCPTCAKRR